MIRKVAYTVIMVIAWSVTYAQHATINSDFERLIQKLSDSYNINIAYAASLTSSNLLFNEEDDLGDLDLREALDLFLSSENISYKILDDDKVLLRKNPEIQNYKEKSRVVTGQIFDRKSKITLPYASIYIEGSTYGTMSDIEGRFSLVIEDDPNSELVVSYLGYNKRKIKCKNLKAHTTISLIEKQELLDEVTIIVDPVAISEIGRNNKTVIDNDRYMRMSASDLYGTDLFRAIQMLPGVGNDSDAAGELRLRGSDADETLIMLDGIPLYKTDHYYGIFSSINPYYIGDVTLYKNKIPLQYENKSGGMLLLNSANKIEKTSGVFEADFLKFNAYLELPISSKVNFILGGRFNHTDPFNSPLSSQGQAVDLDNALIDNLNFQRSKLLETRPTFQFKDINLKLTADINSKLSISASAIGSTDKYEREYFNSFIVRRVGRVEVFNEESYINTEDWMNSGLNLSATYNFDSEKSLRASLYSSEFENNYQLGMGISLKALAEEKEVFNYSSMNFNRINSGGLRIEYDDDENWHFGINIQNRENEILFQEQSETFFSRSQKSGELAFFGKKDFRIGNDFLLGVGARFNYAEAIDTLNFSPLAEIQYTPENGMYLKASYARLYQNFRELSFESRFGHYQQYFVLAEEGLYPQGNSNLFMVGGGYSRGNWDFDAELFYKKMNGSIGFLPSRPGLDATEIVPNIKSLYRLYVGETTSKGIDIYLGYDVENFFSQLAYTYSKTEDSFRQIFRGEPFPSQNDRRHQLKWLNALTVKDFTFSLASVYNSGKPYISFDLLDNAVTRDGINLDNALLNLPAYFRLDLSARYDFKVKRTNFYVKGSVYNLTDRENVEYYQQTFAIPISSDNSDNIIIGSESSLVERLFNISLGVSF